MPQIPIIMPQLGESIAEATIVSVAFPVGARVEIDTDVFEVETNKAIMSVTVPCAGLIQEITAIVGESYPVGATLGFLEISDEDAKRLGVDDAPKPPLEKTALQKKPVTQKETSWKSSVEPTLRGLPVPAHAEGASFLSPRMKARMTELGLHSADLAGVAGSGANGRVTIEDLEAFLEDLERNKITPASSMRVAVADAMRRSWTRPLATVVLPIQCDVMLTHRKGQPLKAGPALYALRALAIALGENSAIAGRLVGARIIHPRSIDIGFAVEAADGVLVPVIRNADQYRLVELVERYNRLVEFARARRLSARDTGGSIATITNYGVFGLTMATPIPLPEQTLLLGMGVGQITPCWDKEKESFVPVTEAQFTLSFDHRVLDGGAAGRLLLRIKELLHAPEEL
ncbi:MAG: 2-oxo acid dehydrogenase subunit E2 [Verrucomicrobiae bacterium]|jgi:pyruvate/2-oxoglutarate dehydrogenase complex dihydrolipoamide acyltransferase (E2) component|nr:2-oxo acid dehydrogenase subunit E2 [Verrucomicrobiae bacterium]